MAQMTVEQALDAAQQFYQSGRLNEAENVCRQLVAQHPQLADAWHMLGLIHGQTNRPLEAIQFIERAISINPGIPDFYYALGVLSSECGRPPAAIAAYQKAIALKPDFLQAYTNLSYSLRQIQRIDEAIAAARKAVQLAPNDAFPLINLGTALHSARRFHEAIDIFKKAIELQPGYALAHNYLGNSLKDQWEIEEAVISLRHSVKLDPTAPRLHSNLLLTLHSHPNYTPKQLYEEALAWNAQHAAPLLASIQPHTNDRSPDRKLKVGYLSPDFREHSVARFLLPLLSYHDRSQFEIHCFSTVVFPDPTTAQIHSLVGAWHDVGGFNDERLAELIRAKQIDLLVDLAGHTAGHRLMTFARKPAPIQIAWLGYPGTTGLQTMDYRLTDAIADPPGVTDSFHTEKLVRLPRTAWCYEPMVDLIVPNRPERADNDPITFGSFNNMAKMNEGVLKLWAEILRRVPQSRLLLKSSGLGAGEVQDRVRRTFETAGVSADRLDLRGTAALASEHLAMYNEMDIALDTFPYNGATTTCESLWMGVPAIGLVGQTHVSRVGASMLTNAGLTELLAQNSQDYVRLAIDLAHDPVRLREFHQTLRQRMQGSALMDGSSFARDVEAAYRRMWKQWCEAPIR